MARGLLRERTLRLSRLLKLEFSYRVGETFEAIFDSTVAGLVAAGLLKPEIVGDSAEAFRAGAPDKLALLAGQLRDFVEAYWVAARGLETMTAPLATKDLVRRIHDLGEKLFYTGKLERREACTDTNYQNAVAYFVERGILIAEDKRVRLAPSADPKRLATEIADLMSSR